ncbi:MAG: DNA primase [Prosthecochloris sp.]|nr:DNA primase [Prosthecochloris sp.]
MIPDQKIDEIRQSTDIVDIVSDYVKLQPSGRNYKALSPFTSEKTPSFVVSPDKQIYKCFSSGKGGNVFTFLMEMEKVSFPEAVEIVARRAGIDISRYRNRSKQLEETAETGSHEVLRWAGRLYNRMLFGPGGKQALEYLLNTRGLSQKTITGFGLGYAPDMWDFLKSEALRARAPEEMLLKTGLLYNNTRKNSTYDYFRNRVMFPIFSVGGKVVGFGGRTLSDDRNTPKYLNSPESSVFDKSRVLYGLHAAKDEIRKSEQAILVEGYMDVLALHQAGITTAVASCGTALTRHQAALLNRYSNQVLFLYDADEAGQKSMLAGIDILLAGGLTPWVATLPEGEDPDSFVRRAGKEGFLDYTTRNRQSFLDFQISYYRRKGAMDNPNQKAIVVRRMLSSVNLIGDRVQQEMFLREMEKSISVSSAVLRQMLDEVQKKSSTRQPASPDRYKSDAGPEQKQPTLTILEKTFLKALMESVEYGTEVLEFASSHQELLQLPTPEASELLDTILETYRRTGLHRSGSPDLGRAIGSITTPEVRDLAAGLMIDQPLSSHWQESFDEQQQKARRCLTAILDSFRHLILGNFRERKQQIIEKLRNTYDIDEEKELTSKLNQLLKDEQKTETEVNAVIDAILSNTD